MLHTHEVTGSSPVGPISTQKSPAEAGLFYIPTPFLQNQNFHLTPSLKMRAGRIGVAEVAPLAGVVGCRNVGPLVVTCDNSVFAFSVLYRSNIPSIVCFSPILKTLEMRLSHSFTKG